ncbi:unnamed protein product [Pedinophyceae sp. YPF-701]|nr:unnamed protein product [Pedinophyceae sp. YPF-701]
MWLLTALLLLCSLACTSADAKPSRKNTKLKPVNVSLTSQWAATPAVLEAFEFLAEEGGARSLWRFIAATQTGSQGADERWNASDADPTTCWSTIVGVAGEDLSATMLLTMETSLMSRLYSPRVHAARDAARHELDGRDTRSACCVVDVGSTRLVTDASELKAVLNSRRAPQGVSRALPTDHVFLRGSDTSTLVAVYGLVGSACLGRLLDVLREAVQSQRADLTVVLRHVDLGDSCAGDVQRGGHPCQLAGASREGMMVPGFGVELRLKSMEYNAMDESSSAADTEEDTQASDDSSAGEPAEVIERPLLGGKAAVVDQAARRTRRPGIFRILRPESATEERPIKVQGLKNLGLKAAKMVRDQAQRQRDHLAVAAGIAQRLPQVAASLGRSVRLNSTWSEVGRDLQDLYASGFDGKSALLLVNGLMHPMDSNTGPELHALLNRIRLEVRLFEELTGAGIEQGAARSLLALRANVADRSDLRVDARMKYYIKMNDVDRDPDYRQFPRSFRNLGYGTVSRPILTCSFVADVEGANWWGGLATMAAVMERRMPVDFHVVLVSSSDKAGHARSRGTPGGNVPATIGQRARRVAAALKVLIGNAAASKFLRLRYLDLVCKDVSELRARFQSLIASHRGGKKKKFDVSSPGEAWDRIWQGTGVIGTAVLDSEAAMLKSAEERGLVPQDGGAVVAFNGRVRQLSPSAQARDYLGQQLVAALQSETRVVLREYSGGRLEDEESKLFTWMLRHHRAVPRYNARVLQAWGLGALDSEGGGEGDSAGQLRVGPGSFITLDPLNAAVHETLQAVPYLRRADAVVADTTIWLVTDLSRPEGLHISASAANWASANMGRARLALMNNPRIESSNARHIETFVQALIRVERGGEVDKARALASLLEHARDLALESPETWASLAPHQVHELATAASQTLDEASSSVMSAAQDLFGADGNEPSLLSSLVSQRELLSDAGVRPGDNVAVVNGRIVLLDGDTRAKDVALMVALARSDFGGRGVNGVLERQRGSASEGSLSQSDLSLLASLILTANPVLHQGRTLPHFLLAASARVGAVIADLEAVGSPLITASSRKSDGVLKLQLVVDPLSKQAQILPQMLGFIRDAVGAELQLVLAPMGGASDLPLETFYSVALPSLREVDKWGVPLPPSVSLVALPQRRVLTVSLDVPEPWLASLRRADGDADNVFLDDVEAPVHFEYELDALLITGMTQNTDAIKQGRYEAVHPRGLQLHLVDKDGARVADTLVMDTLGYFQLHVKPGTYGIRLIPGNEQQFEIMTSDDHSPYWIALADGGGDTSAVANVEVLSFSGAQVQLRLRERSSQPPTASGESEVADAGAGEASGAGTRRGLVSRLFGSFGQGRVDQAAGAGEEEEPVHVMTVASGLLYERLQRIMMLSVVKHTTKPVKFWFIENYMSPVWRASLAKMAAEIGFDYELITYKWPHWLRKQSERQRIIWAYKILFLDVIFPLTVSKMIFVDSDQVVRSDLRELVRHDLQGAPYGYVPFCENNKEVEGFRFWKQGFWKDHLRTIGSHNYHISALYVVDLDKFRRMGAGDHLRKVYHQLSMDPNSLANLDQDLPNFVQDQVPIFSLPQEWLWCETWCGNATKAAAKTIDLCNNPLTKEPKLQMARRIIPEWTAYDAQQEAIMSRALASDQGPRPSANREESRRQEL